MAECNVLNSSALEELSKGNEWEAQSLFRKNVQKWPCCMTLNNLGVYYSQYGMILRNGKTRSAKKVSLHYLLKASASGIDWRNCASASTALLEIGNTELAYQYLKRGCAIQTNCLLTYNKGVCLYRMGKFQESVPLFIKLCEGNSTDTIIGSGGQHPFLILAYCFQQLHDNENCKKYIQMYRKALPDGDRLDVFSLRFMCGMYEDAMSECSELLAEWYVTESLLAMIAECLEYVPADHAPIRQTLTNSQIKLWNQFIASSVLRTQKINEYSYLPPAVDYYCFIE